MTPSEFEALKARVAANEKLLLMMSEALSDWKASVRQQALLSVPEDLKPDMRLVELREALVATFQKATGRKYVFDGAKDAAACKKLLTLQPGLRGELLNRWEQCVRMPQTSFPATHSLAVFASRINSYSGKAIATPMPLLPDVDPYAK